MKRVFFSFYFFVLASSLFIQFGISPLLNRFAQSYMFDKTVAYNRQLSSGVFYMMEQDLLHRPEEQWAARIKELQPRFGYTISLTSVAKLHFSDAEMIALQNGLVTVIDKGEYLYKRVGNSGMVIGKGPFSKLEPTTGLLPLYAWTFVVVVMAMLTVLWIIPYWRKLSRISAAATAFGNGDFDVRANISSRSSLFPIASAFNTMAKRIQQLISSHKDLTNAVSHELRTPISRIRFGLEMLESSNHRVSQKQYFDGLHIDVTELEELVSELLTFARFDREQPDLHFSTQNLGLWLDKLLTEIPSGDTAVLCRVVNTLAGRDNQVFLEPKYMARAIANLIQNGMRYAEKQVLISVERDGEDCRIHIDDDGPGIPEADRQRVFEPFTRLDSSRSRDSGGYGLGLALVSRIASWHNGLVELCDSSLGGARFTIIWPAFPQK